MAFKLCLGKFGIGRISTSSTTYIDIYKERKIKKVKINMEDLFVQLDDLPDEILIIILKKNVQG